MRATGVTVTSKAKGKKNDMKTKGMTKAALAAAAMSIGTLQSTGQEREVFYSNPSAGYRSWDVVANWKIYSSFGGGDLNRLPGVEEYVKVSANTLAAENGSALCVTNGVDAICHSFASGQNYFEGKTTWFRLDGGNLTCMNNFIIGMNYNGLATLESGILSNVWESGAFYSSASGGGSGMVTNNGAQVNFKKVIVGRAANGQGTYVQNGGSVMGRDDIYIGDTSRGLALLHGGTVDAARYFHIGNAAGGDGTVTNNGADITSRYLHIGYVPGATGRMTHNGGTLRINDVLQVGRAGGIGAFDVNAAFYARNMVIGTRIGDPGVNGTGTVTVASGFTNVVHGYLKVNNGELVMRGGTLHFNVNGVTNALINSDSVDGVGVIRGWGSLEKSPTASRNPWMENSGLVIADGEGEERDLSLHDKFVAVTNTIYNGPTGTNGWYAVNKGRLRYPRTYTPSAAVTHSACYGDWRTLTTPSLGNSLKLEVTLIASGQFFVYGELYAPDRSDIPAGLPEGQKAIGIWRMHITTDESPDGPSRAFVSVRPTFRYDHTQVKAHEAIGLYRHNGSTWVRVGSGSLDGTSLISSSEPLPPVDGKVGWFAVVVKSRGTMISVQ